MYGCRVIGAPGFRAPVSDRLENKRPAASCQRRSPGRCCTRGTLDCEHGGRSSAPAERASGLHSKKQPEGCFLLLFEPQKLAANSPYGVTPYLLCEAVISLASAFAP